MTIAPNPYALKRRVDRFLWANMSGEIKTLRKLLTSHFQQFNRVVIIGGLVRDFAREGRTGFKSDVDLVIEAPKEQVAELAKQLGANENVFGGYGYRSGPWKIDFWALETTWARKHVSIHTLEDVISGTFFDWDAIAYDLWERKLICEEYYLDRLKQGTLEINLRPNPSPMGNLVRAIRRLVLWNVSPGPKLKYFIEQELNEDTLRLVQSKERELFPISVSTCWHSSEEAKATLFRESNSDDISKQLEISLW